MQCLDENAVAELIDGVLPPGVRQEIDAHLDECASCRSLVATVASEQESSSDAQSLATIPTAVKADSATAVARGRSVGRYVAIHAIGAGSMGIVYLAYDPELDRRVALKRLSVDGVDESEHRRRVSEEAKAMARLSHPNVVAVHDIVTADEATYIAMEYVDGTTLTRWRAGRSAEELLGAFVQAGEGLAAAHAVNVIHRDFKPDNVLVSLDGRVLVTDFGLAASAAQDSLNVADAGSNDRPTLVGTPRYLAPELFDGEVAGPGADQYSFCYALAESLLGGPPLEGSTGELLSAKRGGQLRSALPASGRVRRALAKGLAPDPRERHASMQALLSELRPRRQRAALAAVGVVGAVAVAGALLASQSSEAVCPAVALDDVYSSVHRDRIGAALSSWPDSEAWLAKIDEGLSTYAASWEDMHVDACEATHVRRTQTLEILEARMGCLEGRRRELRALVSVLSELSPEAGPTAINSVHRLPSVASCADPGAFHRPRPGDEIPEPTRNRLAEARAMVDASDYARASATLVELNQEAREHGPLLRGKLAMTASWLLANRGDKEPTREKLQEALVAAEAAGDDPTRLRALLLSTFIVGYSLADAPEGQRLADRAEALAARIKAGPVEWARLWRYRGLIAQRQGRFDEAAQAHQRSVEQLEAAQLETHPEYPKSLTELGNAHRTLRDLDKAEAEYRRALEAQRNALGDAHPHLANTLHGLGDVLSARREFDEALQLYDDALQIYRRFFGDTHRFVAGVRLAKAIVYFGQERYAAADSEVVAALELYEEHAPQDVLAAVALSTLADLRFAQGRTADALAAELREVELRRRITPRHPDLASSLRNVAGQYVEASEPERALPYFKEASELAREVLGPSSALAAESQEAYGLTLFELGRYEPAAEALEASAAAVAPAGSGAAPTLDARWALARALRVLGRSPDHAEQLARGVLAELERTPEETRSADLAPENVRQWLAAAG